MACGFSQRVFTEIVDIDVTLGKFVDKLFAVYCAHASIIAENRQRLRGVEERVRSRRSPQKNSRIKSLWQ